MTNTTPEALSEWLKGEMKARDWGVRKTARESKLSHATLSKIINGKQMATYETCNSLAVAFGVSPEMVMKLAGLLTEVEPELQKPYRKVWLSLAVGTTDSELLELISMVQAVKESKARYRAGNERKRNK